jgi:hypothetical protein
MQKHKNNPEQKREPQPFNPRAFDALSASAGNVEFQIDEIAGEQCLLVALTDLSEGAKEAFDASKSDNKNAWRSWQNELASLAGDEGVEADTVYTGQTGRQKTIILSLFGVHNSSEVMANLHALNDMRRAEGAEALEGVPAELAYLPENLLMATLDIREQVGEARRVAARALIENSDLLAISANGRRS